MKQAINVQDLKEMLRAGKDLRALPQNTVLTPSARDFLRHHKSHPAGEPLTSALHQRAAAVAAVSARSSRSELETFFQSSLVHGFKLQICDIGQRLWQRAYVDGNGGNLAVRLTPDLVLCTPTLVSKGFMTPVDMVLVDLEGNQLAGELKPTSELLMHLQMMRRQPRAVASVHCHAPYATAFAVVGVEPPAGLIPQYEVFLSVAMAPYRTPGTAEMGRLVSDLVDTHNVILMANHGVVAWSHVNLEDAYFKIEILEGYLQTVLLAAQLGKAANTLTSAQLQELRRTKQSLGIPDRGQALR